MTADLPNNITITVGEEDYSLPQGTTLEEFLQQTPQSSIPTLGALVNGELQELCYPLFTNSEVHWIDLTDDTGIRIYKRSLFLVLQDAAKTLYPSYTLKIEHSLVNGTYCDLRNENGQSLNEDEILALEAEMHRIVSADQPIIQQEVSKEDAIKFFSSQGRPEVKIIKLKPGNRVKLYRIGSAVDYFYEHLAQRTGVLNLFELKPFHSGFILRVPDKMTPHKIPPYTIPIKLAEVLFNFERWGQLLDVENVAQLNDFVERGEFSEIVQIMETFHERQLHAIADLCTKTVDEKKLILIAGPSSSGKTTFAQRLYIQLRVNGIKPITISLDDYFVNRELTPKDKDGNYDFEHIDALEIQLFNEHLLALIQGEDVVIPRFDFVEGRRITEGRKIKMQENNILIVEGIHGLNEKLTIDIPRKNKRKFYISALTNLNIDNYTPISSSDTRLIRRLCRDLHFRGSSAEETLARWASVRRGEEQNIFPYQEDADYIFNSALLYETSVLKNIIFEELEKITPASSQYEEAQRLIRFLQYFLPACPTNVPLNSILREFVGGSCFITC